ncbi:Homeobox-leucine zipper protein REVOLUTA, partial [Camellia lanceoleosa]
LHSPYLLVHNKNQICFGLQKIRFVRPQKIRDEISPTLEDIIGVTNQAILIISMLLWFGCHTLERVYERSLSGSGASPNAATAAQFVRVEMLPSGYFIRPCKGGGSIIHIVDMLVWISCQAS